MTKVRADKGHT